MGKQAGGSWLHLTVAYDDQLWGKYTSQGETGARVMSLLQFRRFMVNEFHLSNEALPLANRLFNVLGKPHCHLRKNTVAERRTNHGMMVASDVHDKNRVTFKDLMQGLGQVLCSTTGSHAWNQCLLCRGSPRLWPVLLNPRRRSTSPCMTWTGRAKSIGKSCYGYVTAGTVRKSLSSHMLHWMAPDVVRESSRHAGFRGGSCAPDAGASISSVVATPLLRRPRYTVSPLVVVALSAVGCGRFRNSGCEGIPGGLQSRPRGAGVLWSHFWTNNRWEGAWHSPPSIVLVQLMCAVVVGS